VTQVIVGVLVRVLGVLVLVLDVRVGMGHVAVAVLVRMRPLVLADRRPPLSRTKGLLRL
jgi:hypothetical protein